MIDASSSPVFGFCPWTGTNTKRLLVSFDVDVLAGEVLEVFIGFKKFVLPSHTSDLRNALLALPRLYKVYAGI